MPNKLMDSLDRIKADQKVTLGEMADELRHDGQIIISLICILPFMQPIPIPGLSSILGIVIVFQAIGLIFLDKPLLTRKLRAVEIDEKKFNIIYKAAQKFTYITNKMAAMPMPNLVQSKLNKVITGIWIILMAAFLSLPLPIPFSNFLPALAIFFLCVGMLEDDLIIILCGQLISIVLSMLIYVSGNLIFEKVGTWF